MWLSSELLDLERAFVGKWWNRPGMPVPTDDNDLDLCRWWAQWYRERVAEQIEIVKRAEYYREPVVGRLQDVLTFYREKLTYYEERVSTLEGK